MASLFRSRPALASTKPLNPEPEPVSYRGGHIYNLTPGRPNGANFRDLPPEIHLLVSKELIYPDALSLKHTSRYFYSLVDTGVRLKVDWLVKRRMLHLDCPNDRKCNLRTDLEFCRGSVTLVTLFPGVAFLHVGFRRPIGLQKEGRREVPAQLTIPLVYSCEGVVNTLNVSLVLGWDV